MTTSFTDLHDMWRKAETARRRTWKRPDKAQALTQPVPMAKPRSKSKDEDKLKKYLEAQGYKLNRLALAAHSLNGGSKAFMLHPDFIIKDLGIVIEIDGKTHAEGFPAEDLYRDDCYRSLGWDVLRVRLDGLEPVPDALNICRDGGMTKAVMEKVREVLDDILDGNAFEADTHVMAPPVKKAIEKATQRIGSIRPDKYGMEGDLCFTYFDRDNRYSMGIINDTTHLVAYSRWHDQYFIAVIDPDKFNGTNRRDYMLKLAQAVKWDKLDTYPDNPIGVPLDDLVTAEPGSVSTYINKWNGIKNAGLKIVWRRTRNEELYLETAPAAKEGHAVPQFIGIETETGDIDKLVTFDYERIRDRGYVLAEWWPVPNSNELHFVLAHSSLFVAH